MKRTIIKLMLVLIPVLSFSADQKSLESKVAAQNTSLKKLYRYMENIQKNFSERENALRDSLTIANERSDKLENDIATLNRRFVSSVVIDSLTDDYLRRTEKIKHTLNLYFAVLASILLIGTIIVILIIRRSLHHYTEGEHSPVGQMQVFVDNIKTAIKPDAKEDSAVFTPGTGEQDHELPIRVAEEVFRMRTRLTRMPADTKGLSALMNAVNRLEDELNIKGYSVIDLSGQPYSDEMTVSVKEFIPHDDLPSGSRRILRMLKPCVRYGSKIISYGECEVAMSSEDLAQR
ncbi:MAG: hypothetical protein JNL74_12690 [Fibrobacteres bacterium]|nr:hypothetical protein [Fibrobacterota bacterium]